MSSGLQNVENEDNATQDPENGLSVLPSSEVWRSRSNRLQYTMTVGSRKDLEKQQTLNLPQCPSMGRGRSMPSKVTEPEDYLMEFETDDATNPYNWSSSMKFLVAFVACFGTFQASFASAVFAPSTEAASSDLGVSAEVGSLGTSLFVLGFAAGPLLWAPGSELVGRRWPMVVGMFGDSIFLIASAVAKDIQTLIICRFFAGLFGACMLSLVPAVLADIYDNTSRGPAITIYALTVFGGPFLAPSIGGFIEDSFLGWRWTSYIPAFLGFLSFGLLICFLKETHAPTILVQNAGHIRRHTENWAIHAKHEEVQVDFRALVQNNFLRPIRMLFTEPVVLFVTIYMSLVYGLVYAFVEAVPYVFETVYGMNAGVASLPFMALIIGQLFACGLVLSQQSSYVKKLKANNGVPVPEWRLPPTLIGAPSFAGGLFWFHWTGFTASIPWIVPTIAGALIGFGILCIFLPCFNYLVDAYLPLAASVVAANILMRSALAAGFPLFTKQMYKNLGVQWAGTLIGCLAAVMVPIPFLLTRYGASLRKKSKMAID